MIALHREIALMAAAGFTCVKFSEQNVNKRNKFMFFHIEGIPWPSCRESRSIFTEEGIHAASDDSARPLSEIEPGAPPPKNYVFCSN